MRKILFTECSAAYYLAWSQSPSLRGYSRLYINDQPCVYKGFKQPANAIGAMMSVLDYL